MAAILSIVLLCELQHERSGESQTHVEIDRPRDVAQDKNNPGLLKAELLVCQHAIEGSWILMLCP